MQTHYQWKLLAADEGKRVLKIWVMMKRKPIRFILRLLEHFQGTENLSVVSQGTCSEPQNLVANLNDSQSCQPEEPHDNFL